MDALATALLASTVAMAVPLLLAALGEAISERAGVINIGLEGLMLSGALAAMLGAYFSGSAAFGVALAIVCGLTLSALLALVVIGFDANQVVAGTALNLFAFGITGVAYRAAFGITGSALTIGGLAPLPLPGVSALPVVGPALFQQSALGYLAFALVPLIAWTFSSTMLGLRLRMVGENPWAARTQGLSVPRLRLAALLACGALAAAGGAFLVVAYTKTFVEGMSAGRGFIALAVVIIGRWSPWGILAAALFFGLASALQFHFQALGLNVPYQIFLMLPYVLTLLVLASTAGRLRAPAGLGR